MTSLRELATAARAAARRLASASRADKDRALLALARRLREEAASAESRLLVANAEDVEAGRAAGLSDALLDRLRLDARRVLAMADAVAQVAAMDDPVGEIVGATVRPNGLLVGQVRAPLGVVAMIYEARPNVTIESFALTLKSGNAVLLRGGKEAARSNAALAALARAALLEAALPEAALTPSSSGSRVSSISSSRAAGRGSSAS
jgi:glutamate-5-semialdehyde dehydrogenase